VGLSQLRPQKQILRPVYLFIFPSADFHPEEDIRAGHHSCSLHNVFQYLDTGRSG
jgi:hypothetical protein